MGTACPEQSHISIPLLYTGAAQFDRNPPAASKIFGQFKRFVARPKVGQLGKTSCVVEVFRTLPPEPRP
jgi:hypothetical protein